MHERIERVKSHFRENKKTYLACCGTAVVVVVGTLLATDGKVGVSNRQIQVLNYKSKQTLEVFIEALGDPGNIVQDMLTGSVYASQGQAARELGVTPSMVSRHLSGKLPDVAGHKLVKLGKAAVAE
jgi:hypothetical protein